MNWDSAPRRPRAIQPIFLSRHKRCATVVADAACVETFDFRGERKNDWREGRKEERSVAWFNVFVISANSPTASWERLCDGQTWFTMRKLKIDEERPVFLRTRHILFPEIIRPVISCQRHQDCIARPILLAMKSRVKPRSSRNREKISKFHVLLLCLHFTRIQFKRVALMNSPQFG